MPDTPHRPGKPPPEPDAPRWSQALRALREARGVSQEGWAALLGVGRRTIQRWESGEAPPEDPSVVATAVAHALGVQGIPNVPLQESILRFLRDKRLLLLLDNYEHLLAAPEFAAALPQAGPGVILLVTSRAPLRVRGER